MTDKQKQAVELLNRLHGQGPKAGELLTDEEYYFLLDFIICDTMTIKIDSGKDGKVYRCVITNAAGEQLATEEVKITVDSSSASGGVLELPFVPADELDNYTNEPVAEVTEPAVEEPVAVEAPAVAEPAPEPAAEPVAEAPAEAPAEPATEAPAAE